MYENDRCRIHESIRQYAGFNAFTKHFDSLLYTFHQLVITIMGKDIANILQLFCTLVFKNNRYGFKQDSCIKA